VKHFSLVEKVVIGAVGIILIIILAGNVLPDVVNTTASEEYSENFAVTTGSNVTTTSETLAYDSYYSDLTGLTAESDNVSDTPVVMSYDSDTNDVGVSGLAASDSRTLTIGYYRESGTEFYGFTGFMRLLPFLVMIGGVIACIFAIYSGIKSR
jgi:hypothetical protein